MSTKLELPKITDLKPRIAVLGVGGAGCNAVNNMIAAGLTGVEFMVANTDAQALAGSSAEVCIQLGASLTEGLGAGSKPEIGEAAAEEAIEDIRAQLTGTHMVFIAAGMGGGTGTGAAAVIARIAKETGILTIAVVTKPFHFEGSRRMRIAEGGIAELRRHVDTLIVIPNQNLFRIASERTTFAEAFVLADQVLYSGIACIVDLIVKDGLINLDLADVRTVLVGMGTAMMGTGEAAGEGRAVRAAEEAIANPLVDDVTLTGAKGLLLSIIGSRDMTLLEVDAAANRVRQEIDPEANIIVGATFDDSLGDRVRVSIVASGMQRETRVASGSVHAPPPRNQSAGDAFDRDPQHASRPASPAVQQNSTASGADLTRRLGEAMSAIAPAAAQPMPGQEANRPRGGPWHAPGDVLIEENPPQLIEQIAAVRAAHSPDPGESVTGAEPARFAPQPPAEFDRSRRHMPAVDDFPPLAQAEFRAKAGRRTERGDAGEPPSPFRRATPPSPKKGNFFQRLTGVGRSRERSDGRADPGSREAAELPQFFHREPRRR